MSNYDVWLLADSDYQLDIMRDNWRVLTAGEEYYQSVLDDIIVSWWQDFGYRLTTAQAVYIYDNLAQLAYEYLHEQVGSYTNE